jgi:hypothetical protein
MGRFSLPLFKKILILLPLTLFNKVGATEIADIKILPTISCDGKEIPLSGAGLRTATILKIKIYVLALYTPTPIRKDNGPELEQRPICFDLTYLRDFDNGDVDKAWKYQFEESAEHKYGNFKNDLNELQKIFGEIKGKRNQFIEFTGETSKFYENGKLKGEIKGKDFQKTFLSIWFGKNPPTEALKENLLKSSEK